MKIKVVQPKNDTYNYVKNRTISIYNKTLSLIDKIYFELKRQHKCATEK
jgi:hypothetical protein